MGVIRELPPDEIEALLRTAIVGRIACCGHGAAGDDGRPYLVPLAYGYDGAAIYAHSGPGRKIRLMRAQPLVSIEVDAAAAADDWRSVIAEGVYEEIETREGRDAALRLVYPPPATVPDLPPETVVYRIRLTAKSGRYEMPSPPSPLSLAREKGSAAQPRSEGGERPKVCGPGVRRMGVLGMWPSQRKRGDGRQQDNVVAARDLRRRLTSAEQVLWDALRDRRLDGLKFRRQHPVGPFVLDFCCADLRLGIELDGSVHDAADHAAADVERQRLIESSGYTVVRYRNEEVLADLPAVLADLRQTAARCRSIQLPSPAPR